MFVVAFLFNLKSKTMTPLEEKILAAFEEADGLLQGGNAGMVNVKLKLKEAAAYVNQSFGASLAGKLGVGATLSSGGGRHSFAWNTDLPVPGSVKKKAAAALKRVAPPADLTPEPGSEIFEPEPGSEIFEDDPGLYEKLAELSPAKIAAEYKDSIEEIAETLGVTFNEKWNATQRAAAVRTAAKAKLAEA